MPERSLPMRQQGTLARWLLLLKEYIAALFLWRPKTVLGYLVAVAVAGIVLALALIVGVKFHLLHRIQLGLRG